MRSVLRVTLALLLLGATARGQPVEPFYKGRTITLVVGVAPAGLNDISGRLVARHLGRFIPGQPAIVVQNVPGAGGLVTANRLFHVAEKDGSVIAGLGRAIPQLAIQGVANANFDPLKFTWLGSLSSYGSDAYVLVINVRHPARTVADLRQPAIRARLGADRAGATNLTFATLAKELLGLHVDVVRGYTGAAQVMLAQQTGEVDGQVISLSSIKAAQRDLWTRKQLYPVVQFGRTSRLPELADVPTGRELVQELADPAALALLDFAELPFFMALPFVAPPGIPPERAAALRSAFMQMCRDEAFRDEAARLGLDLSPIDGNGILALLERAAATPKDVIARYNALVGLDRN